MTVATTTAGIAANANTRHGAGPDSKRDPGEPGGTLLVDPRKCTGCRTCELTCAVVHGHQMRPARSRVRAYTFGENRHIPLMCLQCDQAACVRACPVEALVRNAATEAIEVDHDRCVRCKLCVAACPFGNIYEEHLDASIVKCDLCAGDPMCAKFCPSGALVFQR